MVYTVKMLKVLLLVASGLFLKPMVVSSNDGVCEKENCQSAEKPKCRMFKKTEMTAKTPSIIYGDAHGRLGNQLLVYAALAELKHSYGFDSYASTQCKEYITKYFSPESFQLPVLSETFCNSGEIQFEPYEQHIKELLTDDSYRRGRILNFYPRKQNGDLRNGGGYKPEDHISPEQEVFSRGYTDFLRKTLKFRPRIETRVKKTLKKIAKKMGKKSKYITYVGIHNRRTDHLKFIKEVSGLSPITADFFYDAMDYFREEYENVAFVYVSDDMEWGRKNLKNDIGDIFFDGAGEHLDSNGNETVDPDAVSYDLALLMSCNHTIITRGTYSMWAAILAGGEYYTEYGVIVPHNLMHQP